METRLVEVCVSSSLQVIESVQDRLKFNLQLAEFQYLPTITRPISDEKFSIQGTDWNLATVDIGEQKDFQIKISATVGKDHRSDIAIDDIHFANCTVG